MLKYENLVMTLRFFL